MIKYVQFFPTLRCNKNCDFCFSKGLFYDDFPEEKIEEYVAFLSENKINSLDILGGEPFLYKPLNKLIKKAIEKNIEVTISTNGTFIKELRNFIKTFENKKVRLGISINESPTDDLLQIIKDYKPWIKSVINKTILPEAKLMELAKNLGIKYYFIYMDVLTDRDLKNSMPFYEFMEKIKSFKNSFFNIEPVFCKGFIGSKKDYRCPAGTEKISIMPDGSIYPCYLLGKFKEYCLGNLFKNKFSEIISSSKINIFKKYIGNICHNKVCSFYGECNGGCVAHSIIYYGTHEKPDPRCSIISAGGIK